MTSLSLRKEALQKDLNKVTTELNRAQQLLQKLQIMAIQKESQLNLLIELVDEIEKDKQPDRIGGTSDSAGVDVSPVVGSND
jgi:hypothetical protein